MTRCGRYAAMILTLLQDGDRTAVGSRAGAVVREVVVLSVSWVSPFVPVETQP